MHMKSSNLLYLFDFDGTLFGQEEWKGIIKNWKMNFSSKPHLNPENYDIRWSILTGRLLQDKPLLKLCCLVNGLTPEEIIVIPKWTYPFKTHEEKYKWKFSIMFNILKDEKFASREITRIVYIDNDFSTNDFINTWARNRSISLVAVNVVDFINKTYQFLL